MKNNSLRKNINVMITLRKKLENQERWVIILFLNEKVY